MGIADLSSLSPARTIPGAGPYAPAVKSALVGRATSRKSLRRKRHCANLRDLALFSSCSDAELFRVASLATDHVAKSGQVLAAKDDRGLEFFIILEGVATVTRNGVELARLGRGSFFGELALLDGATRTATVVAETDMRLLVLSRREFNSLHHAAPSVAEKMLAEMGKRLRSTDDMLEPALAG